MTISYWDKQEIADEVRNALSPNFSALAKALNRLDARLDVMEQAIADPHSEAAEELRKKHGMDKKKPTKPLATVRKV